MPSPPPQDAPPRMGSPRARAKAAAYAAATLVLAAVVVALAGGDRDRPVGVAVDAGAPGRAVRRAFLGLSMEWTSVAPYGGPAREGVVALLRRVETAGGGPVALRVGGASAEEAWWNPSGRPRPPTVRHDIGPETLADLAALAGPLDAPVTVGLNLQLGDAGNGLALARAARRRLGARLDALEVGNEPDLYTSARTVGPVAVRRLRKRTTYGPDDYERDAGRLLDVLGGRLGGRPPRLVVGSLAAVTPAWSAAVARLVARSGASETGAVGAHRYALPGCERAPAVAAERARLLSTDASRRRMEGLAPLIALAHEHGLPLRVAELSSAPCGGTPGVSDTFAAALWLVDSLFALLRAGADAAYVQTWDGAVYAAFARRGAGVEPRAPFHAMLAFARAAPRGSRLVTVRLRDAGPVRAWATVDRRGTVRLALIAQRRAAVRVAVPAGQPCATVRVTTAPSLAARAGIADRAPARRCPRGRTLPLTLPGPSLTVVELPRAG